MTFARNFTRMLKAEGASDEEIRRLLGLAGQGHALGEHLRGMMRRLKHDQGDAPMPEGVENAIVAQTVAAQSHLLMAMNRQENRPALPTSPNVQVERRFEPQFGLVTQRELTFRLREVHDLTSRADIETYFGYLSHEVPPMHESGHLVDLPAGEKWDPQLGPVTYRGLAAQMASQGESTSLNEIEKYFGTLQEVKEVVSDSVTVQLSTVGAPAPGTNLEQDKPEAQVVQVTDTAEDPMEEATSP